MTSDTKATKADPDWVTFLDRIHADGTVKRLTHAQESGDEVRVLRSSGQMQPCKILGLGHAGLSVTVTWSVLGESRYKTVKTEDFLQWNPSLDAAGDAR